MYSTRLLYKVLNGGVATTPSYLSILKIYPTLAEGAMHPVFTSK